MKKVLEFDMAAIGLLVVVIFSLIFRKDTKSKASKYLLSSIICVLVATAGDLLGELPANLELSDSFAIMANIATYFYFAGVIGMLLTFLLFILATVGYLPLVAKKPLLMIGVFVPIAIGAILLIVNAFTGIIFRFDGINYVRGVAAYAMYAVYVLNIVFTIAVIIKTRKLVNIHQFATFLFMYIAGVGGMIVQFLQPKMLIMCFCLSIAISLVPITISRPDFINFNLGIKNASAFYEQINLYRDMKKTQNILFAKLNNEDSIKLSVGIKNYDKYMSFVIDKLRRINGNNISFEIYALNEDLISIVFSEGITLAKVLSLCDRIKELFNQPIDYQTFHLENDVSLVFLDGACVIEDNEMVLNFGKIMNECIPTNNNSKILLFRDFKDTKEFKIKYHLDEIINRAIAEDKFFMVYQPIYSLKEKRFNSAEALIRLQDPKFGFIPPDLFIQRAERTGAIHKIGDYVLNEVIKFAASKEFARLGFDYIELNLSTSQLCETDLATKILALIKHYKVSKEKLNFEVTESFDELDDVIDENLNKLSKAGVHFSLDDYGTGYSNMRRIIHMPLDIIKMDRIFVLEKDKEGVESIIKNTVQIIKDMGKHIVIEGVETKEEKDFFEKMGVDYVQGYFYSKPLQLKELKNFIENAKLN